MGRLCVSNMTGPRFVSRCGGRGGEGLSAHQPSFLRSVLGDRGFLRRILIEVFRLGTRCDLLAAERVITTTRR